MSSYQTTVGPKMGPRTNSGRFPSLLAKTTLTSQERGQKIFSVVDEEYDLDFPGMTSPEAVSIYWEGHNAIEGSKRSPVVPYNICVVEKATDNGTDIPNPTNDQNLYQPERETCDGCDRSQEDIILFWCGVCETTLCDVCWDKQSAHSTATAPESSRKKKKVHEKTSLMLRNLLESILDPDIPSDPETQERIQAQNDDTKWFGVELPEGSCSKPYIRDYGRYARLAGGTPKDPAHQYPSLISFIGETGAGKSTLVNALVKVKLPRGISTDNKATRTPVIGDNTDLPTSSDVHLFADPSTFNTNTPYLYADCEGLRGGIRSPRMSGQKTVGNLMVKLRGGVKGSIITWGNGRNFTREFVVKTVYPRVLFTFSDVVCFVTKNCKTLDNIFARLITWASAALEISVNQPVLPYALVIVNALEKEPQDSRKWGGDFATEDLLSRSAEIFQGDNDLKKLADQWVGRGKQIKTLKEMLLCYFSGIKILYIPHASEPPSLIDRQYNKLYELIDSASRATRETRARAKLLMNSEELEMYFTDALTHFSNHESKPFDFLTTAFLHKPIPTTFKDHICKLADHIRILFPNWTWQHIFSQLAPLVASYILLDTTRNKYLGRASAPEISKPYNEHCRAAIEDFFQRYWPCGKLNRQGQRCSNVASGHQKGHQSADGNIFDVGPFESECKTLVLGDSFTESISAMLAKFLSQIRGGNQPDGSGQEKAAAASLHKVILGYKEYAHYWKSKPSESLKAEAHTSHTICFVCLFGSPIHPLRCGHVLCDHCVEDYSERLRPDLCEISVCPLCNNPPWEDPWKLRRNLEGAGVRVLCLDGGGIRSIIQLDILAELEKRINLGVDIRLFFDLIVGTSGGGILALGLGLNGWSVEKCTEGFIELIKQGFTRRFGVNVPVFGQIVRAAYHSKYETTHLEKALKNAFGEDPIFGGGTTKHPTRIKVAVTATSSTNLKSWPYLITNYNRLADRSINTPNDLCSGNSQHDQQRKKLPYRFFRGDNSQQEMRVWEAARASSAAPGYFEPFEHQATGYSFDDGGLKMNNPVLAASCEMNLLWPDRVNKHPDILLSIGTGSPIDIETDDKTTKTRYQFMGFLRRGIKIFQTSLEDSMDCDRAWENFMAGYPSQNVDDTHRYHRLNPKFPGALPELDNLNEIPECSAQAKDFCASAPDINIVAAKLIASLFYFKFRSAQKKDTSMWDCKGTILCRLEAGSPPLKKLCRRLKQRQDRSTDPWGPSFSITESDDHSNEQDVYVSGEVFTAIDNGNRFELDVKFQIPSKDYSTRLCLSLEDSPVLISGFPRKILRENESRGNLTPNISRTVRKVWNEKQMLSGEVDDGSEK